MSAVDAMNRAYTGLENRVKGGNWGTIRAVHLACVDNFLSEVRKLQADEESWKDLPIDELKKQLRIAKTDLRGVVGPQALLTAYWKRWRASLETEIQTVRSFLPAETLDGLTVIASNITDWGVEAGVTLTEELVQQSAAGPTGLFLATPRLTELARTWRIAELLPEGSRTLSRRDINTVRPEEFLRFIVLNSPAALMNARVGPEGSNLLRALFFGAASAQVVFVTPANFTREADRTMVNALIPQEFGALNFHLTFEPVGQPTSVSGRVEEDVESVEEFLEELPQASPVSTSDAPRLETGAQSCRLIHLQANLALPVETDSSWVTKLWRDEDGVWRSGGADPFLELEEGDLLLAQLDSSESADLHRRARIEMGDLFDEFERSRARWKTKLKLAAGPHSSSKFISELRQAGLQYASRYQYWLTDDAISPQTNADFLNLLAFLGLDDDEISVTMRLTKQWKASLIAEGQRPGREIADFLNREEHSEDFFVEGRSVVLEELGNARFLISPVIRISETEIQCDPSQVRRVVRTEEG